VKRLITMAIIDAEGNKDDNNDDNKSLVYVKEYEKYQCLTDILDSDNLSIKILVANYEDIDSLI